MSEIEYYQKLGEALEQLALDWMIKEKKLEHLKEQPAQEPKKCTCGFSIGHPMVNECSCTPAPSWQGLSDD